LRPIRTRGTQHDQIRSPRAGVLEDLRRRISLPNGAADEIVSGVGLSQRLAHLAHQLISRKRVNAMRMRGPCPRDHVQSSQFSLASTGNCHRVAKRRSDRLREIDWTHDVSQTEPLRRAHCSAVKSFLAEVLATTGPPSCTRVLDCRDLDARGSNDARPSSRRGNFRSMSTERQKMLAGELYDPFDLELVAARSRARVLCHDLNATREPEHQRRRGILRELFGKGGDSARMQPPFHCDYGTNIELGESVFFNLNCIVLDVCAVRIGDFTLFGPAVQIYTPLHPFNARQRRGKEFGNDRAPQRTDAGSM
jgi:hypothetical protein